MKLKKLQTIKRLREDIWGRLGFTRRVNKRTVGFLRYLSWQYKTFYTNRRMAGLTGLASFKAILHTRKKIRTFYGGIRKKDYMRTMYKAKRLPGNLYLNIVYLFEFQLYVVVYRMNFAKTIEEAKLRVRRGFFSVNREVITNPKRVVNVGSVIEVVPTFRKPLKRELLKRVKDKEFFVTFPRYMEVNYTIFSGLVLYKPSLDEVPFPFYVPSSFFISELLTRFR